MTMKWQNSPHSNLQKFKSIIQNSLILNIGSSPCESYKTSLMDQINTNNICTHYVGVGVAGKAGVMVNFICKFD